MESIDNIVSGFHNTLAILESEEVEVVKVEELEELHAEPFLMVRRFLTSKPFHQASLIRTLKHVWHTREEFSPIPLEDPSLLLFSFKNEFDKRKIMQESPWNFDRALLLFGAKYGWVDPIILPLDSPCFWV